MESLSNLVTLVTQRNPLDPGSRVVQYLSPDEGATVGDVLPPWVHVLPEGGVQIRLNGEPARLDQLLVHGDIVEVLEVPLGLVLGGALIPAIAGTATATAASAAATAAFLGGALGLAKAFALSFLAGKLLAPNKGPSNPGDEASPTYRFGGISSNQDAEGAALPLIFGQIRTGGVVVQRYTRASLTSTYLYTLIALSEGPIEAIGDVDEDSGPLRLLDGNLPAGMEINGRPAEDYEDIELHVRLGDLYQDPIPGFEASSVQYPVEQALPPSATPGAITITPKDGGYDPGVGADATELAKWDTEVTYSMGAGEEADEFSATVTFAEGMYTFSGSGAVTSNSAEFQIRYQELDGTGTPVGKVVVLPAEGAVTQAKTGAFDVEFRHPFIDPATYLAPVKGFYLKLQGVNGCVTKASPFGMTDPAAATDVQWSTSGWVKTDINTVTPANETYHIWNFWDSAANRGFKVWLRYENVQPSGVGFNLYVQYGTGSGNVIASATVERFGGAGSLAGTATGPGSTLTEFATLELERWHHVAITYGGSSAGAVGAGRLKLYWDGALVKSLKVENINHRLPTAGTVRVGAETNSTNFADADFDVFKLFLRELNSAEVQVQYADGQGFKGTGSEPDLLLCWAFDTSSSGTTPDLSPNVNAGTLVGSAAISTGSDFGIAPGSSGGTFKRGRYKVEIQRLNAQSISTVSKNSAEWTAIQLVTWADFRYPGVALVGIRQKASDQLQGGAPTYTFEVKGRRVPVWNGASIVTPSAPLAWSQNPAWIAAGVLTSEEGLGDRYQLKDLKLQEFKAWADWCDEYVPDGLEEVVLNGLATKTLAYNGLLEQITVVMSAVISVPDKWKTGYHVRLESLTGTNVSQYLSGEGEAFEILSANYVLATQTLTLVLQKPDAMAAPTVLPVTLTNGKVRGAERRMQCDIVLDRRNDEAVDVLERIFATGRAQRVTQGGRVGVFVDRPASPVALVTHASVAEGSLETTYTAIDQRPNVIQAEILDRDAGYTVQRLELEHPDVQNPASFNGRRVRSINLEGIVRRSQALREIKYQLNLFHLVRRSATWSQPALAIARQPGDVVMVAHDVPQWGFSGKLRDSNGIGPGVDYTIFLDRDVTIPAGTVYMVIEDSNTNKHATFTVQSAAGTYLAGASIVVSGTQDWIPAKGDYYSLGSLGKIYKRFRVLRTKLDGQKIEVEVEASEYNEGIYADDFGSLPLPETSLTTNALDTIVPEAVQNLTVTETTAANQDGSAALSATLNWTFDPDSVRAVQKVEVYAQPFGNIPELRLSLPGQPTAAHLQLNQTDKDSLIEFFVRPVGARGQARSIKASARGHLRPLGLIPTPSAPISLGRNQTGFRAVYTLTDSNAARVKGYELRRGGWIVGQRVGFTASGDVQFGPTNDLGSFTNDAGANGPYLLYARALLGSGQFGKVVTLSSYATPPGRILFERHLQDHGATGWSGVTLTGFTRAVSAPGTTLIADNITSECSIDYTMPALREAQACYVYIYWQASQAYAGAAIPEDTPLGNRWTTEGPLWTYSGETENTTTRLGWKYGTTSAAPSSPLAADGFRPGEFYMRRGRLLLRFSRSVPANLGITLNRAYIAVVEAPAPRLNFPNVEAFL